LTPEQPFEAGEPDWPALDDVRSDPEVWRSHPQITPALRRSLKTLDRDQALAVYRHVSLGSCENFYVYTGGRGQAAYPWRLPESLREGLEERVHDSALDAARDMGERLLFQDLSQRSAEPGRKRIEQRLKRIEKNLGNLDRDVERLTELRGFKEDGEAIKAVLHEYGPEAKMERIEVPVSQGGFRTLELDSKLTLLENMERSFKLAAKGRRGLEFAKSRRRALEKELAETRDGGVPPEAEPKPPRGKGKETSPAESPKGVAVHVFETDDGFTLYRGKNSKANHELLSRLAGRHDLWFHARGVSGSHVVLKRDHPGQEVPERSLRQAAAVAGMASGFSGAGRAEVVCALVKDLRKRKGAGHGLVAVDKEYRSLVVDLDEKEIQRLKR
jgi:predicted ribosome quality control (RQC) complex YloA/Tae2 family protein